MEIYVTSVMTNKHYLDQLTLEYKLVIIRLLMLNKKLNLKIYCFH